MPDKINIDIDAILNAVKGVRGSMVVATRSIDGMYGGDCGFFELNAMVQHLENIFKNEMKCLTHIVDDLRKGGAKDYESSDNWIDEMDKE